MHQRAGERHPNKVREMEGEKEGVRRRKQRDAVLSSFKTTWSGRLLIRSPNGCCYPYIAAPLKRTHGHKHTTIRVWKHTPTSIRLHNTLLSLLHMSNPDVLPTYTASPLYTPPSLRIKRMRKQSGAHREKNTGRKWRRRGVCYTETAR